MWDDEDIKRLYGVTDDYPKESMQSLLVKCMSWANRHGMKEIGDDLLLVRNKLMGGSCEKVGK